MGICGLLEAYRLSDIPLMLLSILISQGVLLTTISILGVVGNSMTVYVLVKVTDFTGRVPETFTNYECLPQTEEKQVTSILDVTNSLGLQ